jgi:hypothetical protein
MVVTDIEAHEDDALKNQLIVNRSSFWDDSLKASRDQENV